jgi:hypothetical protein
MNNKIIFEMFEIVMNQNQCLFTRTSHTFEMHIQPMS